MFRRKILRKDLTKLQLGSNSELHTNAVLGFKRQRYVVAFVFCCCCCCCFPVDTAWKKDNLKIVSNYSGLQVFPLFFLNVLFLSVHFSLLYVAFSLWLSIFSSSSSFNKFSSSCLYVKHASAKQKHEISQSGLFLFYFVQCLDSSFAISCLLFLLLSPHHPPPIFFFFFLGGGYFLLLLCAQFLNFYLSP